MLTIEHDRPLLNMINHVINQVINHVINHVIYHVSSLDRLHDYSPTNHG